MEGRQHGLEGKSRQQHHDGGHSQPLHALWNYRQGLGNHRQIRCTGHAIQQRHAVEHHRRGDRAIQKVFEPRLVGFDVIAKIAGQHVGGDAQKLHTQVDGQQIGGRRSQANGQRRKDQQSDELAPVGRAPLQVRHRSQDHQDHRDGGNDLEKQRIGVHGHQRQNGGRRRAPQQQGRRQRPRQADEGQGRDPDRFLVAARFVILIVPPDKIHAKDHDSSDQQDQFG